jgi:hypothetical protein
MADDAGTDAERPEDKYLKWYGPLDELSQGAVLTDVIVFEETVPPTADISDFFDEDTLEAPANDNHMSDDYVPYVAARSVNVIVLTQSCDIPKPAQQRILVAEVQSCRDITAHGGERSDSYGGPSIAKTLWMGRQSPSSSCRLRLCYHLSGRS